MSVKANPAVEQVCKAANSLFPELNVRPSDIVNPTEAFLVRILVTCLKAYGFRVDPPYNIDSDDASKMKRVFLAKLCRQVQKILQISFPSKTYTYYDITQPTAKTTLNTLDVLINYWCFYRMHKKSIIQPIIERIHERQALITVNAAKRNELEQQQQSGVQDKIELKECEANMHKLHDELTQAKTELKVQSKALRQVESEMAVEKEMKSQIESQLKQISQLVVLDSDVADVKMETKELTAQIESRKLELEKLKQIYNERRVELETIAQLSEHIDEASNIVPPEVLSGYKDCKKTLERVEKTHKSLVENHQNLLDAQVKLQEREQQNEANLKARILQCEEQVVKKRKQNKEQELAIEQQSVEIEELQQTQSTLEQQLEEEQRVDENLKIFVSKLSL
ncbi:hyaluronan mediated motility receptor [Drosophila nasuta]|uniref:hyaluronan mediated motility receptor n=1 Tax=Drosophila nasuta TaxID=42062 RepID=UPI00295E28FC|nr:hyaluronan mediated motility receptor [Drosophila nasuta]